MTTTLNLSVLQSCVNLNLSLESFIFHKIIFPLPRDTLLQFILRPWLTFPSFIFQRPTRMMLFIIQHFVSVRETEVWIKLKLLFSCHVANAIDWFVSCLHTYYPWGWYLIWKMKWLKYHPLTMYSICSQIHSFFCGHFAMLMSGSFFLNFMDTKKSL